MGKLQVLFYARRQETLTVIRRAAENTDLVIEECSDPEAAVRLMHSNRYNGVILDHDANSAAILRELRTSPSSRDAIAVDVHGEEVPLQTVFALGANFELVYPLTVERARRTLHLAAGLMALGLRRYYRHPVEIAARAIVRQRPHDASITNLSEQGIAIRCRDLDWETGGVLCSFDLPDHQGNVVVRGRVIWSDESGNAGCRIEQFLEGREEYVAYITQLFEGASTRVGAGAVRPERREPIEC